MSTFMSRLAPALLISALAAAPALATQYEVDPAHSTIGFSVKHMMMSTVAGHFNDMKGEFEFDTKTGKLGANKFEVKSASVDTGNPKRDGHLKSPDFFNSEKFPLITVTDSKVKKTGEGKYDWDGMLTIAGVSKPVHFEVEMTGEQKGPDGAQHVGFTANAKIKRSDWGLKWNKALESGGVLVSDEVKLSAEVEATAKK